MSDGAPGLPEFLADVEGTQRGESMFSSGPALWVNGKEILHPDAPGRFDVRLTRGVIRELRDRLAHDARVHLRRSISADWVEVEVQRAEDEIFLRELVELAVQAHPPPQGASSLPPPTGAALQRRRRFH